MRERLALTLQGPLPGFPAAQQATQQCAGTRQQVAGPAQQLTALPGTGCAAHLPVTTLPRVLLSPRLTGLRETESAVRRLLTLLLLERSTSAAAVLGLRTGLPLRGGLAAPITPCLLVPGALSAAWAAEALASASSAASTRRTCTAKLQVHSMYLPPKLTSARAGVGARVVLGSLQACSVPAAPAGIFFKVGTAQQLIHNVNCRLSASSWWAQAELVYPLAPSAQLSAATARSEGSAECHAVPACT